MNIDFKELLDVTIRAISSLVTLFLVTKMLGKKQVSQLSLFDYVIGISIGNFAAEMTINLESHELNGIWAVVLFGLFCAHANGADNVYKANLASVIEVS